MGTTQHTQLKSEVAAACLDAFPEAKAVVIWGGATTREFTLEHSDIDVIIEVDDTMRREHALAERLKSLVQNTRFCRLDPFIYLTGSQTSSEEPLEFIAPFGFYKANAFIPYLIRNQNEVLFGESRLLNRLPNPSLDDTLKRHLPQVMASLRRLRMDAEVETSAQTIVDKHKPGIFVALRTLYAFDEGKVGSKLEALSHLPKKFPDYAIITEVLKNYLSEGTLRGSVGITPNLLLAFAKDMAEALQAGSKRNARL